MREFDYKLKEEVNGEKNPYHGVVKIKLPKFIERNKMLREVTYKVNDKGETSVSDNLDSLEKMADILSKFVLKVEVYKGEKSFHTLEELEYDNGYTTFILDVGMAILQGVDLGNG